MKPTRIFLDLDDVLNRFTMPALYHVGCPVNEFTFNDYDPKWGYDIIRAVNALHPGRTFTESEFWNSFNRSFWASLPESEEFEWLVNKAISYVGENNVYILSSPTRDPDCLAGKLEWIQRCMPFALQRSYLLGPSKHLCANSKALLIDDREQNVDDFRAHGGRALLVPRPWNRLHWLSTELYLQEKLKAIFDIGMDGAP